MSVNPTDEQRHFAEHAASLPSTDPAVAVARPAVGEGVVRPLLRTAERRASESGTSFTLIVSRSGSAGRHPAGAGPPGAQCHRATHPPATGGQSAGDDPSTDRAGRKSLPALRHAQMRNRLREE